MTVLPSKPADEIAKRYLNRKARTARSIARNHDFGRFERDLFEVLRREIKRLLDESYEGPLAPSRSKALMDYLRVSGELKEHKKLEAEISKLEDNKDESK